LILAGTRKGLFLVRGEGDDRRSWQVEEPLLTGWEVFHAVCDPRAGTLHACTNNWVYGASVHRSADGRATWERSEGLGLPEESGLALEKTWHVEEALHRLPVADLLLDERGRLRSLVNVYVDGVDVRDCGGLDASPGAEIRVVAAVAGGSRND
jgi:hypothetical protein